MKPGSILKWSQEKIERPLLYFIEKGLPTSQEGKRLAIERYIVIKKNLKFTGHWLLYDVKNSSLVHATAAWTKSNLTEVT